MGINAVGTGYDRKAAQLDAFINMDDKYVRDIAWLKTQQNIDFKRHKREQRALDVALPLAGGISAAAAASKGKRLSAFAGGTANWVLFLAGLGATFGLTQLARNKSEKIDNFAEKHPILSFVATATAAYFAGRGAMIGGAMGLEKLKSTGAYKKVADVAKGGIKKLGEIGFVKKSAEFISNNIKKIPSPLKQVGKVAASWAPIATIVGTLAHAVGFRNSVAKEYNTNYADLKEKQLKLAQQRNQQLSVENDLFKVDVKKEQK